jgi:hypothetical protein
MLPPYNQIICEIAPSDNESGLYCQHRFLMVAQDEEVSIDLFIEITIVIIRVWLYPQIK